MSFEQILALDCIGVCAVGVIFGAVEGFWHSIHFELVGIKRRKRIAEDRPKLTLGRLRVR